MQPAKSRWVLVQDCGHCLGRRSFPKRRFAGEHLVQHNTLRKDVTPRIGVLSAHLRSAGTLGLTMHYAADLILLHSIHVARASLTLMATQAHWGRAQAP